ncbi:MAG: hypothetical protein IJ493_09110 [Clostridia bacterium]|nr:hypothetical protein [Clostridia bacterium]
MKALDINQILGHIEDTVRSHEIETGAYSRWTLGSRSTGINPYGCADAANILYTLNRFPKEAEIRTKWIAVLQSLQDPITGLFSEGTHLPVHTTAHCLGALELFDAGPLYPVSAWEAYRDTDKLHDLLNGLDWEHEKGCGHIGAAVYAIFALCDMSAEHPLPDDWRESYFDWFDSNCDPETGVWRKGHLTDGASITQRMGSAFHFYFNYSHARRSFPYPEALIDCCLDRCHTPNGYTGYPRFGEQFHYIEMDWVYCLNRASRQTPHRFHEIRQALYEFAAEYVNYLNQVEWESDPGADDLHMLFGTLCCLAELQQALPGVIHSSEPLRLVLDRRPFI